MSVTDPTVLYRLRDGVYARDLLIVAIAELDLFTLVHEGGAIDAHGLCKQLGLDARAVDVMVTYLAALGLLERGADGLLHDWSERRVRHLLSSSFAALPPGGWFVDHDTHINQAKTGPLPVAEYSVLLMHSTPGKCWSVGELAAMLDDVGFTDIATQPTAADRTAIVAQKPS